MKHAWIVLGVALLVGCEDGGGSSPDGSVDGDVDGPGNGDDGGDGGGAGFASVDECFEDFEQRDDRPAMIVSFESEAEDIEIKYGLWVGDRSASGETIPWDLGRFAIELAGTVECITAEEDLLYEFEHHNWDDHALAEGNADYDVHSLWNLDDVGYDDTLTIGDGDALPLTFTECEQMPPLDEETANLCYLRNL